MNSMDAEGLSRRLYDQAPTQPAAIWIKGYKVMRIMHESSGKGHPVMPRGYGAAKSATPETRERDPHLCKRQIWFCDPIDTRQSGKQVGLSKPGATKSPQREGMDGMAKRTYSVVFVLEGLEGWFPGDWLCW